MKSKMKKLVSLVLAMAMVFTMSAVVFAENSSDTCTVTIKNTTNDVTYTAYKLLNVTTDGTNYSYTENSVYSGVLSAALTEVNASTTDVVAYLSGSLTDSAVQDFADAVYENLSLATTAVANSDYYTVNGSDATTTFTVSYGYYLIVEASAGDGDSVSLVMLDTADNDGVEFTTKEDVPKMTKKIKDTNDSTGDTSVWQDSADYDIGDDVPYQLTATLPSTLSSYDTYKLIFHDVMQSGLTFNSSSVKVYADGVQVADTCYQVLVSGTDTLSDSKCTFEIVISDVKTITPADTTDTITVSNSTVITVEYTAELNKDAVIGNPGNWNTAYLEYSNNPYASGDGSGHETGKTPEDTVVVLTYDVIVNKVDEDKNALTGAEFKLEKYVSGSWVEKTLVKNDEGTSFSFTGLDDGWYRITETKTPSGYNSIDPIYFIVTGTHTETSPDSAEPLTDLDYDVAVWNDTDNTATATTSATTSFTVTCTKANTTDYLASTDIENKSGTLLPSTGGIGTTIFYIVGAVLVLGAGVVLVTRRRTRA